jgi:integrase
MMGGEDVAEKSFYKGSIDVLGDGTCLIYQRADALKKGVYQARIRVPGAKGYSTRSTKHTSLELAKKRALELLEEAKINVALGLDPKVGTFTDVYLKFWESTLGKKSVKRRQDLLNEAKRYFFEFFQNKKFARIAETDVNGYWAWRRRYWLDGTGAKKIKDDRKRIERARKRGGSARSKEGKLVSSRGNVVDNPSQTTCDMTASHLREVWKWAVANGHATRVIDVDSKGQGRKVKAQGQYGASRSRRGWWTDVEYRKLTQYLTRWSKGRGDDDDSSKLTKKHHYGRRLLRDYFLFLANSGLRTGEADALRWRNIKLDRQTKDGTTADVIMLTEGKTGSRKVVIRDEAGVVLRRRKDESEFTKADDFVFCSFKGGKHGDLGKVFVQILEHLDMREDEFGSRRSLYSARHQYATYRLKYGGKDEQLTVDELAQNMGTSANFIYQHYSHKTVEDVASKLVGRRG